MVQGFDARPISGALFCHKVRLQLFEDASLWSPKLLPHATIRVMILVLTAIFTLPSVAPAAQSTEEQSEPIRYVFIVDVSRSMNDLIGTQRRIEHVRDAIARDFGDQGSGIKSLYKESDQIDLWLFNHYVEEALHIEYDPDQASQIKEQVIARIETKPEKLGTDILKPLLLVKDLLNSEEKEVFVFLYTDGQDNRNEKDFSEIKETIKRAKQEKRLGGFWFIKYGPPTVLDDELAEGDVFDAEEGEVTPSGVIEDSRRKVDFSPSRIEFSAPGGEEILLSKELIFSMDPPNGKAELDFKFQPDTAGIDWILREPSTVDLTKADQTLRFEFMARNIPDEKAVLTGTLLVGSVGIVELRTDTIPVTFNVTPPEPDVIQADFSLAPSYSMNLPASDAWQSLEGLVLSVSAPEDLEEAEITVLCEAPSGLEVEFHRFGESAPAWPVNETFRVADLGNLVAFRVRLLDDALIGQPLTLAFSLKLNEGAEGVSLEGKTNIDVPVQFDTPVQIVLKTQELDIGTVTGSTEEVTRVVNIDVQGKPEEGAALRLVKEGQGLADLVITPSDGIALMEGPMGVEFTFSGFRDIQDMVIPTEGRFEGTMRLVPSADSGNLKISETSINVVGKLVLPAAVSLDVEGTLVAGAPIVLHATPEGLEESAANEVQFTAFVKAPGRDQERELPLFDDGAAAHGDLAANDGIHSNVIQDTDELGGYLIRVTGSGVPQGIEEYRTTEPVLFRIPDTTLKKRFIVAETLTGPLVLPFEVESENVSEVRARCATESLVTEDGTVVGDVSLRESGVLTGEQTLNLEIALADGLSGWYEATIHLEFGPTQDRTGTVAVDVQLQVVSPLVAKVLITSGAVFLVLILLAIWVFILVPLGWERRLKAAAYQNVITNRGGSVNLAMACRKNRWKHWAKIFCPSPRAYFGGEDADIVLVDETRAVYGRLRPRTRSEYGVMSYRAGLRLVPTKDDRTRGQSGWTGFSFESSPERAPEETGYDFTVPGAETGGSSARTDSVDAGDNQTVSEEDLVSFGSIGEGKSRATAAPSSNSERPDEDTKGVELEPNKERLVSCSNPYRIVLPRSTGRAVFFRVKMSM